MKALVHIGNGNHYFLDDLDLRSRSLEGQAIKHKTANISLIYGCRITKLVSKLRVFHFPCSGIDEFSPPGGVLVIEAD